MFFYHVKSYQHLKVSHFIFFFIIWFAVTASAQQLSFQHFDVGQGLSQAQVNSIVQDRQHHLWVGTIAGLDRFDGSTFRHFTKNDGLQSSSITSVYTSRKGVVWTGTFKGVSCYDGYRFYNFTVKGVDGNILISSIEEDPSGTIWVFDPNRGLFRFEQQYFVNVKTPFTDSRATCLYKDSNGDLLVNFYAKGIYRYSKSGWSKISLVIPEDPADFISSINSRDGHYFVFTSGGRVLKLPSDMAAITFQQKIKNISVSCFDNKGNIWIGTNRGVVVCSGANLATIAHYTASSGLTDNYIRSLYRDFEGNIWIGSDGEGLFKFSGSSFLRYDRNNGMPGNIVMGFASTSNFDMFLGFREAGLVRFNLSTKKIAVIDYSRLSSTGVNCIGKSHTQSILLGTLDNKLLEFNGHTFREIIIDKRSRFSIISILSDSDRTWINTAAGCYYLRGDTMSRVKGVEGIPLGPPLRLENDQFLIGSTSGVYFFREGYPAEKIRNPVLMNLGVSCFGVFKGFIVIGTFGDGLYFWNRKTEEVYQCDIRKGLSDNQVFSLFTDRNQLLWVGTGSGLHQVTFDAQFSLFNVKKFSNRDGYENAENNLTAIAEDHEGRIWTGTNKGIFIYSADTITSQDAKPLVVIQQVDYPGRPGYASLSSDKVSPWYHLPHSPVLSYSKNNISFTVKGIFLKDPSGMLYSSQLVGYDKKFSSPSPQNFFNYQHLEPGYYVFRVKAISAEGEVSGNIAEYPFSIERPFHKTVWAYLLGISLIFMTGIFAHFLHTRTKQQKIRQLDLLRLEEQQKIRQQTSEDFHDELGNKLTRISLLTDILEKKIGESEDQLHLTRQIKDNILALYAGTRDIIWSLSPASNQLEDILNRIRQFGEDLFQDSEIDFIAEDMSGSLFSASVPMDYGRNLIMIFKELLTNSLRHSGASRVLLSVSMRDDRQLEMSLHDNGRGFNTEQVVRGNGLNNIQRRAGRLAAFLEIKSDPDRGTRITIRLKIPLKGG